MFKIFHKLFGSIFLNTPSVHFLQPKAVNLYFKNSKNPTYKLLNLTKYDSVEIEIVQTRTNEDTFYSLNLNLNSDKNFPLNVADFESKTEAEDAALLLKNKLFSPEKTALKFLVTTFITLFIILFLLNVFLGSREQSQPQQVSYNPAAIQQQGLTPEMIQQQLQQIQRLQTDPNAAALELQKARQQAADIISRGQNDPTAAQRAYGGSPAQTQAPKIEVPQDPNVKGFMEGL